MNILILGGTHFVGKSFVNELIKRNHNITIFNRGISNPDLFPNVEFLKGDRMNGDYTSLENRVWDTIIDVPTFPADKVKETLDVLYDRTERYVYISSGSVYDVYRDIEEQYLDYCWTKLESERVVFDMAQLKSLIVRPIYYLIGEDDNTNRFDIKKDGVFYKDGRKVETKHYAGIMHGDVSIWEPIKIRVMELIDEGNQSEVKGWVLSKILATITKEFDEQASRKAREFILVEVVNKPELV